MAPDSDAGEPPAPATPEHTGQRATPNTAAQQAAQHRSVYRTRWGGGIGSASTGDSGLMQSVADAVPPSLAALVNKVEAVTPTGTQPISNKPTNKHE